MNSTNALPRELPRAVCVHCRMRAPQLLMVETSAGAFACRSRVSCEKRQRRLASADFPRPMSADPAMPAAAQHGPMQPAPGLPVPPAPARRRPRRSKPPLEQGVGVESPVNPDIE